tara:strand:- start:93 stop:1175 length:1083 start_codon:yes stop_codon:yes gene_type:complete
MDFFCTVEKSKVKQKEKERIFFVDKYRPSKYDDFIIHADIVEKINNILKFNKSSTEIYDIVNIFLYGPNDSGKYCLARYYIETYFNDPCVISEKTFTFESKELTYYQSHYHYELIVNNHNCNIINLVKRFLVHIVRPINSTSFNKYKNVILIKNIHLLKPEVTCLLKYYLDKHFNNIFILIGCKTTRIIDNFFCKMRVPLPDELSLSKFIKKIIKLEGMKVKKKELNYILQKGERKIFKTLCFLENCYISGSFEEYYNSQDKILGYIYKLMKKPSIQSMIYIRDNLNQLLVNNMSLKSIIYFLEKKIKDDKKIKQEDKIECISYLVDCELNFRKGYREIHHLEYSIIKIMNYQKNRWLEK